MTLKEYAEALEKFEAGEQACHERHAFLMEAFSGNDPDVSKLAAKELEKILILLSDKEAPREEGYPTIKEADGLLRAADACDGTTPERRRAVNCLIMDFYGSGDKEKTAWATEVFVVRNQGFIGKIISKHFPSYVNSYYEDMYEWGRVAVLETLPRFDPRVSATGSSTSFFTFPIINKIYGFINYETNGTNPYYSGLIKKVVDARQHLIAAGDRDPNTYQIAVKAGIPISQATTAIYMMETADVASLEESEELKRTAAPSDPLEEAIQREQSLILAKALRRLKPIEFKCICWRYGIGCDPLSNKQIEEKLRKDNIKITSAKVDKIINGGLWALRNDVTVAGLVGGSPRASGSARDVYDDVGLDDFCETFDI